MSSALAKSNVDTSINYDVVIEHHRKFEELITKISTSFIKIPTTQTDSAILEALQLSGEFASVDRAFLVLISDDRKTFSMSHEWYAPDIDPASHIYKDIQLSSFKWLYSRLLRGDAVSFSNIDELPKEATDLRQLAASRGIKSLAAVPLHYGGTLHGLLGFTKLKSEKKWCEDTVSLLRVVAEVLVNAIRRRMNEEALLESESRFRVLVESLGEGILLCDRDDVILHVNSRMAELTGYTPDQMIGKTATDCLLPAPERQNLRERTLRRLQGISEAYQIKLQKNDGTRFWAEINATPIRNREGHIVGTLGAVTDISDRKRALEDLEASESKYRNLVETSSDIIWSVDCEGRWTFINQAVKSIYGYEPVEMLGRKFSEFQSPDFIKKDYDTFQQILNGSSVFQYETKHLRKDGKPIYLSFNAITLKDKDGEVIGTTGTASDITMRREAERKLRKSEERFSRYFELPLIGMALISPEGIWREVNSKLCEMLGFTKEELLKKSWIEVTHPEDRTEMLSIFDECSAGKQDTFTYDRKLIRKDGQIIYVSVSGGTVRKQNGSVDHFVALFQDITARKESEETNIRLQKQLLQSQKMEAIGQLAAGIAHDLNNALAAVVGHLQLLSMSHSDNPDSSQSIDVALNGCQRASSLIEQLLGFSRQGKYNLQQLSLQNVVKETIQFLKKIIGTDIKIDLQGQSQDLNVYGDPSQLQQVLTNLIINAKQAMPNGGSISFQFGKRYRNHPDRFNPNSKPGIFAYVSISDSGTGIAPENLDKVFEPFFTTKSQAQGTGLGLSMVYGIMQSHGGWVEVDSIVGYGSNFSLYFPEVEASDTYSNVEPQGKMIMSSGTVLVIDDEKVLVDLAKEFLRRAGFTSYGFCDVKEALEWFKQNHSSVDMVVLDMKMPGMDGKASFEAIKEIAPNSRVVILSGYSQDGAAQEVLQSGALKFFQKPLKYPELINWIAETIGKQEQIKQS